MLSSKASSILASAARPSSRVTGAGKVSFSSPSASGTSVVDNDMVDVGRLQLNVCIKIGEAAYCHLSDGDLAVSVSVVARYLDLFVRQ